MGSTDPLLNRRPAPLPPGIRRQPFRHRIAIHDQPVEHQRKIGIGNAPLAEKIVRALGKQIFHRIDQLFRRGLRRSGQGSWAQAGKHDLGGTFLPYGHQIATQPCLDLASSRPVEFVLRIDMRLRKRIVEIFRDRRRLGQGKIPVHQSGNPLRQRFGGIARLPVRAIAEIDGQKFKLQPLFLKRHEDRHGIRTQELGVHIKLKSVLLQDLFPDSKLENLAYRFHQR